MTLNGIKLYEGVDYATGAVAANRSIGIGSVTIVGKGDYTGTRALRFKILPTKTSVSKVKAGKRSVAVSYKRVSSAQAVSRYQVSYRVKGTSTWSITTVSAAKSAVTIKRLKKGKVYEVRVRSFKTVSGANYYSAWSASKYSGKVK